MEFTQIKETCLYISDLNRTRDFYVDKLGLTLIAFVEDSHVFFRAGSSVLLCFLPDVSRSKQSPPPHYGAGKLHLAFEAPAGKYETMLSEIKEKSIKVYHHETWAHGTRSFYFDDPDGHVLEILEPGVWD